VSRQPRRLNQRVGHGIIFSRVCNMGRLAAHICPATPSMLRGTISRPLFPLGNALPLRVCGCCESTAFLSSLRGVLDRPASVPCRKRPGRARECLMRHRVGVSSLFRWGEKTWIGPGLSSGRDLNARPNDS
jgi:hypothetical protein